MESYTDGAPIYTTDEGGHWTDWGCDGTCAILASSAQARSGNLSAYVSDDNAMDAVLDLGNKIFGQWGLEFWMYVPAGKEAYMNFQGTVPIGSGTFPVGNIFFNEGSLAPGEGLIDFGTENPDYQAPFTYPEDEWFRIVTNFDVSAGISSATFQMYIDDVEVVAAGTPFASWDDANQVWVYDDTQSIGGIDFYSISTNNQYYLDDICYGEGFIGSSDPEPDIDNDGDGFTEEQGDCNDNDATIYPGAEEICDDGIDQDCNGSDCTTPPPPPPGGECSGNGFTDDFENYATGSPVDGGPWLEWVPGIGYGTSSDAHALSGTQSMLMGPNDGSGPDIVLDLGNKIFGQWGLEFWMYIPTGKEAYMNIQGQTPIGSGEWVIGNWFFNQDGANPGIGSIDDSALGLVEFNFPHEQWFPVVMNVDISLGIALATIQINVDGNDVLPAGTPFTSANGTTATSLGGINIYSISANNEVYFDDFCYGEGLIGTTDPEPDVDNDGDGFTEEQGDCNDNDATIYPGAEEICDDGIDQNCDGSDLNCNDVDNDDDGFTENEGDCNDNDATIYPGAEEICDDGIDQDCNGSDLLAPTVDAGPSIDVCEGPFQITGASAVNFDTIIWSTGGSGTFDNSNILAPIYTPSAEDTNNGGGMLILTVENECGIMSDEFLYFITPSINLTIQGNDAQILCNGDQLETITYFPSNGGDVSPETLVTGLPSGIEFINNGGGGIDIFGTPTVDINVTTTYTYTISNYTWEGECPGDDVIGTITIQPCNDIDNDGDGFTENQGDCNDNNATIYPGAEEICDDGIDQDCDGSDCESEPCDISNPSNNFETGIINSGNFIAANDLIITNNFTLTQINLNLFHESSATISTLAITYYEDAGGVPGALIGAETLVPASQAVVGSNFGYNVSEVILDISPVNFTEGTYWIGITAVSSTGGLTAWETTSASSIGAGSAISEDGGNSWGSGRDDGVFTLIGTCND